MSNSLKKISKKITLKRIPSLLMMIKHGNNENTIYDIQGTS